MMEQQADVSVVCYASMDRQQCYRGAANMPEEAAHLTLVVVFERQSEMECATDVFDIVD